MTTRPQRKSKFSGDFSSLHKGNFGRVVKQDPTTEEEQHVQLEIDPEDDVTLNDGQFDHLDDEYVDVGGDAYDEGGGGEIVDEDFMDEENVRQMRAMLPAQHNSYDAEYLARIKELEKQEKRAMEFHWPTQRVDEHGCVWLDLPFMNSAIAARLLLHAVQDPTFVTPKIPKDHPLTGSAGFIVNMHEIVSGTQKTPEHVLAYDVQCHTVTIWDRYNVRKKETFRTNEAGELEQCLALGPTTSDRNVRGEYYVGNKIPVGFDRGDICIESTRRKSVVEPGLCRMVFVMYEIVTTDDGQRVLKETPDFAFVYYRWYVDPHEVDESDVLYSQTHQAAASATDDATWNRTTRSSATSVKTRRSAPIASAKWAGAKPLTGPDKFDASLWLVPETHDDNLLLRTIRAMERQENAYDLHWMPEPRVDESGVTWLDLPFMNRFSAIKIMLRALDDPTFITQLIPYTFPMSSSGFVVNLREMGEILKLETTSKLLQEISLDNVGHWMRYNSYKKETFKINESDCVEQCFSDGQVAGYVKRSFFTGTDIVPPGFAEGTIGLETRRRHAYQQKALVKIVYTIHDVFTDDEGMRRLAEPHMAFVYYRWYIAPREVPPSIYGQGPDSQRKAQEQRRSFQKDQPQRAYCRKSAIVRREARALLEIGASTDVTYHHLKKMIPTNNPCFEFSVRTVHNETRHLRPPGEHSKRGRPRKYFDDTQPLSVGGEPRWKMVESEVEAAADDKGNHVHVVQVDEEDEEGGGDNETVQPTELLYTPSTSSSTAKPVAGSTMVELTRVCRSKLKQHWLSTRHQLVDYLQAVHPELFQQQQDEDAYREVVDDTIRSVFHELARHFDPTELSAAATEQQTSTATSIAARHQQRRTQVANRSIADPMPVRATVLPTADDDDDVTNDVADERQTSEDATTTKAAASSTVETEIIVPPPMDAEEEEQEVVGPPDVSPPKEAGDKKKQTTPTTTTTPVKSTPTKKTSRAEVVEPDDTPSRRSTRSAAKRQKLD